MVKYLSDAVLDTAVREWSRLGSEREIKRQIQEFMDQHGTKEIDHIQSDPMSFTILHYACGIKATKLVHVLVHDFKASTRARNDVGKSAKEMTGDYGIKAILDAASN